MLVARCAMLLLVVTLAGGKMPPRLSDDEGQTDVTTRLNSYVSASETGVYTGGKGILVRNPFDGYEADSRKQVVPATFVVDDIVVCVTSDVHARQRSPLGLFLRNG